MFCLARTPAKVQKKALRGSHLRVKIPCPPPPRWPAAAATPRRPMHVCDTLYTICTLVPVLVVVVVVNYQAPGGNSPGFQVVFAQVGTMLFGALSNELIWVALGERRSTVNLRRPPLDPSVSCNGIEETSCPVPSHIHSIPRYTVNMRRYGTASFLYAVAGNRGVQWGSSQIHS